MDKLAKNLFYEKSSSLDIYIYELSKEERNKILSFLKDDNLCKIADKNFDICPVWLMPKNTKVKNPLKIRNYKFNDQLFFWVNWWVGLFEEGKVKLAKHIIDYILNEYDNGNYPAK